MLGVSVEELTVVLQPETSVETQSVSSDEDSASFSCSLWRQNVYYHCRLVREKYILTANH
uniref:Uncharacterized protein n=1 Tax=Arion vulgaris TaxID=1028688 RepID=A0A0B7A2P5_9EUPU